MSKPNRILIVLDTSYDPAKMFLSQVNRIAKGFIILGHDVRTFSYCGALRACSPFRSRRFSSFFYKSKVDELLATEIANYQPHLVLVFFPRDLDHNTIARMRKASPNTVFAGCDGDPWPRLQRDNRIQTARSMDILMATNGGEFLADYKRGGVPLCAFMPNLCDPSIDRRYSAGLECRTDILWTGRASHSANSSEMLRAEIVHKLAEQKNCKLYGCLGRPIIGGIKYLYAISGARIGVSVNAINSVRLYHSDRLTHYLACGTFVLAKRVPDTDLLFEDGVHLKYFDSVDEFFELADWYLKNETEREKIARAGMEKAHSEFNCERIAKHLLDLIETGTYDAPWATIL